MTETQDYRARYYDPAIGRFISEDPIGFSGGPDFYAYVRNRPTNLTDPLGLCDQQKCTAAQKAAAQLASLFDNASTESGRLAFGSGVGTVLSGAGEGITFGGDTPVTITFASMAGFFGTVSAVTGLASSTLNTFAQGKTTALQNSVWSQLASIAATAAASKIPGMARWADTLGDLASKAYDVTHDAGEACQ